MKLSNNLFIVGIFSALYLALIPVINFIMGGSSLASLIALLLAIVFIFLAIFVIAKGYINNRKVQHIFTLVALLSMGFILFYSHVGEEKVKVSSVTKDISAKVITDPYYSRNSRMVLLSKDDVITVKDVKNGKEFEVGDEVRGIKYVKETKYFTDIFGQQTSYTSKYIELKGK